MPLDQQRRPRPTTAALPLFRSQSMQSRCEPLHGAVCVALPPRAWAAAVLGTGCVLLLALACWLVEVPQRTRALGVLMPPDGFLRVVAAEPGRVEALYVRQGERVDEGQALLRLTSGGAGVDSRSYARLQSLRLELALHRDMEERETGARARRAAALSQRLAGVADEMRRAEAEAGLLEERAALLGERLQRFRSLVRQGSIPAAQLEEARLALLEARAGVEALHRQVIRVRQERGRLLAERAALDDERALRAAELAIARERLARELPAAEALVGRELRAARAGVVARFLVQPGQPVQAGQTLATLYSDAPALEAWLYVPSAGAGTLRPGQAVQLSFDAWPRELFGTQAATVSSISAIALLPSELDVPIALSGPVFEVRATLGKRTVGTRTAGERTPGGDERIAPFAAGTAVNAELVQHRYRLYERLLGIDRGTAAAASSPADA